MPRRVRVRKWRSEVLQTKTPAWVAAYFLESEKPQRGTPASAAYLRRVFFDGPGGARALWKEHEAELVAAWVAAHPGTRPGAWWRHTAPEPRRQLSGTPIETGALHEQVDDEGLLLGLYYFPHGAVTFESQAVYLKRLGLLLEGEVARIKPSAYKPEALSRAQDDGHDDEAA